MRRGWRLRGLRKSGDNRSFGNFTRTVCVKWFVNPPKQDLRYQACFLLAAFVFLLSPAGSSSQGIQDKETHRVADAMVTQTGLTLPPGVKDVFAHMPGDPGIVRLPTIQAGINGIERMVPCEGGKLELPKRPD
jgi:hypothetical protein